MSVTGYESPYVFHADLPGGDPLAERVVMVVLDGIRLDVSRQMPALRELAQRGSSGTMRVALPSLSNPNRAVLVTGAWPEVNGVTNNGHYRAPAVDSVFSLAKKAGLTRAVAGSSLWRRAFGDHVGQDILVQRKGRGFGTSPQEQGRWQDSSCRQSIDFLDSYTSGFLVAGMPAADRAGHDDGGKSEAYRAAALAVDRCLGSLVSALDNGRTAFVIASDHGHIHRRGAGGHGGSEEEVVNVPLVLAGRGIRESHGWHARIVDVTPTICALLGLPLPATNQGDILWQTLEMSRGFESWLRERLRQQRELAASKIPDVTETRRVEKRERAIPAVMAFLLLGALVAIPLHSRRAHWRRLVIGVAAYFVFFYLLFFTTGLGYSLSDVGREEYLLLFLGANIVEAGGAFVFSLWPARRRFRNSGGLFTVDLAFVICGLLGLRLTWIYWTSGLFMKAVMLDLDLSFEACLHLLQVGGIVLAVTSLLVFGGRPKNSTRTVCTASSLGPR